MSTSDTGYYLPEPSHWPLTGSVGLFLSFLGGALFLNGSSLGPPVLFLGLAVIAVMLFGWFGTVIRESVAGMYNRQVDVTFRWSMGWFIFSEVMFFAAFFGALFYARKYAVPWLDGEGTGYATNEYLWPDFVGNWPMSVMPDPSSFSAYESIIPAWGVPAMNTMILLSSGVTITFAHWALKRDQRRALCGWLFATFALGFLFLGLQAQEYYHAYHELGLTLNSGIYGSTFFMLTGFHGLHVTIGSLMLVVIWLRSLKGHFSEHNHFGFEGVAWYWHFVDVVWLFLFVFVYWF